MRNKLFSYPNRPTFVWGQVNFLFNEYQCLGVSSQGVRLTTRLRLVPGLRSGATDLVLQDLVAWSGKLLCSIYLTRKWFHAYKTNFLVRVLYDNPLPHSLISYFCATERHLISTWKHLNKVSNFRRWRNYLCWNVRMNVAEMRVLFSNCNRILKGFAMVWKFFSELKEIF